MEETRLRLGTNEASDLAPVLDAAALARHGWDAALATVLDELPAEESLTLLVHSAGAPPGAGWDALRIECKPPRGLADRTTDAESCACHDGWLYIAGSQYGSKAGPLEPRRSWLARVRIDDLAARLDGGHRPRLQIARLRFGLHRAINDALLGVPGLELMPPAAAARAAFIDATIDAGARGGKRWAGRVKAGDQPVNVEGAAFRAGGGLLLGLRRPVTADGKALLVELDDVGGIFGDPDAVPSCRDVWILDGVGSRERPAGVRALHAGAAERVDAVLGSLDGVAAGAAVDSTHVSFALPRAGGAVAVDVRHTFNGVQRVEGVALVGDKAHYVVDEDGALGIRTQLLSGS